MVFVSEFLVLLIILIGFFYLWLENRKTYWKRFNIPYIQTSSFFGNIKDVILMRDSAAECLQKLYNHKIAENQPFVGIRLFHKSALLIREPELVKRILVKDFNKFSNRFSTADPHVDSLGAYNLFFLKNPKWKQIRAKLTPTFTSGKMKQMFSSLNDIGKQLDKYLSNLEYNSETNSACIEIKEICALFTTDVIANFAFGIQANSLLNPKGEFRKNGRKVFHFTPYRAFEFTTVFFLPQLSSLFRCKLFPKESSEFIRSTINFVMSERKRTGIVRNDLIDTLIALENESDNNKEEDANDKFNGDKLIAQAAVFFTAGFEPASSTMAFSLFELCKRPDLQKILRNEIKETLEKNNGDITYELIQNMEYLNMVLQEVLRLYPPLPFLDRTCMLSEDEKGYSLEPFGSFSIPNGMPVYISIYGSQRDPKYFPDPDVFNPDRFSPENKNKIPQFVYMPFGIGPHNCIGERFGLMQTKIGLIHFLKNHFVRKSSKTPEKMKLEPKALIIQSQGGIHCEIVKDPLIK